MTDNAAMSTFAAFKVPKVANEPMVSHPSFHTVFIATSSLTLHSMIMPKDPHNEPD